MIWKHHSHVAWIRRNKPFIGEFVLKHQQIPVIHRTSLWGPQIFCFILGNMSSQICIFSRSRESGVYVSPPIGSNQHIFFISIFIISVKGACVYSPPELASVLLTMLYIYGFQSFSLSSYLNLDSDMILFTCINFRKVEREK